MAAAPGDRRPPPSPACTQTVSSVSSAASALATAATEAAICLTAGAYGRLNLSGTHSGNVTVEPVPGTNASLEGVSIAPSSSYVTIHNFTISGGVSLAAGDSHITIDHNDINGQGSPGGIGEGVETLSVNCTAPHAPTYSGCTSTAPDTYITINGNKIHGYGEGSTEDAIHLNDWEHVTITANDIYDLEEHGNHTDAMQSVFGGHYMTFAYNYEHDNQSQGFFIKDGDASEVTVTENLFLRNDNEPELYPGGEYNIQVFDTTGFTMTNNTVWDGQDDIIRAEGAAEALTANVNHNVEQNLDVLNESGPAYALSEDYDIFKEEPFTFTPGPHSKVESSPDFTNPASEDYELASNPDGIGVDWQPSEYVYGPIGD
jgi:Right handed beta helix region